MKKRGRFILDASAMGWRWLVEISNHIGAAFILLAVIGVSALGGWRLPHWWWGVLILAGFYVLLFAEGAFRLENRLSNELRAAEQGRAPGFPDLIIKVGRPLAIERREVSWNPGHHETVISISVRVTNREMERRAILSFTSLVQVTKPVATINKLSRLSRDKTYADSLFLPDPLKVDAQDALEGEVLFSWDHDMDFLLGREHSEEEIAELLVRELRLSARDEISGVSVLLEFDKTWRL